MELVVAHAAHTTSYARGALLPRSGSYADIAQMGRAAGLIGPVMVAGSSPAVCARGRAAPGQCETVRLGSHGNDNDR